MQKLEIGTTFDYNWDRDDDDGYADYDEVVTVGGYVYYEGTLYYTCIGESGVSVDVHHSTAEDRVNEH